MERPSTFTQYEEVTDKSEGHPNGKVDLNDRELNELKKLTASEPVTYLQTRELKQMFGAETIYELIREAATEGYVNAREYVDQEDLENIRLLSDAHWKTFITATNPEGELKATDVAKQRGIKPTTLSSHLNLIKKITNIDRQRGMLLRVAYPEEIEHLNEERVLASKKDSIQRPSLYEIKTQLDLDDISLLNDLALGLNVEMIAQMQGRQVIDMNSQLYYHIHAFLGTRTNSGAIGLLLNSRILDGEQLSAHFNTDLFDGLSEKQKQIALLLTDKQNRDREINELGNYDGSGMTSAEISFELNSIFQQLEINSREELTVYMHKVRKPTEYGDREEISNKEKTVVNKPLTEEVVNEPLTKEQVTILKLLAHGQTHDQICQVLGHSRTYFRYRISDNDDSILKKLNSISTIEAVYNGFLEGYISPEEFLTEKDISMWDKLTKKQKKYVTAATDPDNLSKPFSEIAQEHRITAFTLKNALTRAYKTLNIQGRMQLMVFRLKYESKEK